MTLLQRQDGDDSSKGASYLEFVDFIVQNGAPSKVDENLEELWRRIVFSIAVSNSDAHLRNHGFLLTEEGWELSPAYDINPNEAAQGLSLNISLDSNALDFALAFEVADRLSNDGLRSKWNWYSNAAMEVSTLMEGELQSQNFPIPTQQSSPEF